MCPAPGPCARADVYADALAGAPLAGKVDAPVLLTAPDGLHSVYVTEGAHADPGRGWPDAMSIAPVAAHQGRPILLVERDRLPSETDRYATSVAAAEVGRAAGLNVRHTWLATGASFPDALAAGPQVARSGGVLLLVDGDDLDDSPTTRDFLYRHICAVDVVTVLGGRNAISARAQSQATSPAADCASTAPSAPTSTATSSPTRTRSRTDLVRCRRGRCGPAS